VGEDGCDVKASGAFHVHEEGVRALNQSLQLVLALLVRGGRVQEVGRHGYVCGWCAMSGPTCVWCMRNEGVYKYREGVSSTWVVMMMLRLGLPEPSQPPMPKLCASLFLVPMKDKDESGRITWWDRSPKLVGDMCV